eukprot:c21197_g1_i1.p1 GENE.c21197_g1_i1~~c21197_g1_i1.p1  ORF type:complete len:722 (+),score=264.92 c21197_g1_i1:60-2225(+)
MVIKQRVYFTLFLVLNFIFQSSNCQSNNLTIATVSKIDDHNFISIRQDVNTNTPHVDTPEERLEKDKRMNPWKYNQCFNLKHACRNTLNAGFEMADLDAKSCWIHQNEMLMAMGKATIMCKKPLLKCDCGLNSMYCDEFFNTIACTSESDREGMCTTQMGKVLTHYLLEVLPPFVKIEAENGNHELETKLKNVWGGNFTGHNVPEFMAQMFCDLSSDVIRSYSASSRPTTIGNPIPNSNGGGGGGGGDSKGIDFGPVIGNGWKLVRRVQAGGQWFAATDHLAGTDVYGQYSNDFVSGPSFSIDFSSEDYNQFLFITGDLSKWLIASKSEVQNKGNFFKAKVFKSSLNPQPHEVKWFHRQSNLEDPWISLQDHFTAAATEGMLYGENSNTYHLGAIQNHKGSNVFIRKYDPSAQKNTANKQNSTSGQIELKKTKYEDYHDFITPKLYDTRPCFNDSSDDIRVLQIENLQPKLNLYSLQRDAKLQIGCGSGTPAPPTITASGETLPAASTPQFDDPPGCTICKRGAGMEEKCKSKGSPCTKYTDQLPYSNSDILPCRKKPSMSFLDSRLPLFDSHDKVRNDPWNTLMERGTTQSPPKLDPYVDPLRYTSDKETRRILRVIAGDEDGKDLTAATVIKHKETDDIPAITRQVDMETVEAAAKRRAEERKQGLPRQWGRRQSALDADATRIEQWQIKRNRRLRKEYFERLRIQDAKKRQEALALIS